MVTSPSIWFGTRNFETWVKAPQAGGDSSRIGFSGALQYLNGGAAVRASQSAHREYSWAWSNVSSRDEIRTIIDFAEGIYDTQDGVNLIYFIDPMTSDKNVLPQNWATPALAGSDAVPLLEDEYPVIVDTPANTLRYPARSATYTITPTSTPASIYLPVPPGLTPWVGVHGDSIINVTSFSGASSIGVTTPTGIPVTSAQRVNTQIPNAGLTGIELSLATPAAGGANIVGTLSGIIVQMLPASATPAQGGFISGQGHSGCQFAAHPQETPYSVPFDQIGMTAKLIETGAWL